MIGNNVSVNEKMSVREGDDLSTWVRIWLNVEADVSNGIIDK